MANLNSVHLIGRLTRDPETKTFANGGKVASFGFAVNNRKFDQQKNEWVDDPCFLEVKAFNRKEGRKLADLVEESLRKGQQVFIEGHLVLEQWENKGEKRQAVKVYIDNLQFLEPKGEGQGGGQQRSQNSGTSNQNRGNQQQGNRQPASTGRYPESDDSFDSGDDIPF